MIEASLEGEKLKVACSSDMYAIGVILWELLSLRKPYADFIGQFADVRVMMRMLEGHRPNMDLIPPAVRAVVPGACQAVQMCLAHNRSRRPTAAALRAVLEGSKLLLPKHM